MHPTRNILSLLLLLAISSASQALAQATIRLLTPGSEDVVEGRTPIEAEVTLGAEGMRILKVDFYVDGERIGWRDDPPYRVEWDAGNSLRTREIRAIVYASDGHTYEASVETREIRVDYRERVSVVNVFATVRDFGGDYTSNLKADDFRLLEDGVPQTISHFAYENLPLHIVLLLDVSLTMRGDRIDTAREAAARFARSLDFSRDRAAVITFAGSPAQVASLTGDEEAILAAIQATREEPGGTALYDGIVMAVEQLADVEGRKAVILLSDGRDESGDGFRPGSLHTFEEALEATLHSEAIFYSIGVGKGIRDQKDFYGVRTVGRILESYAEQTGGQTFYATRLGQLRKAWENIATALRHQYNLGYTSTNPQRDGSWREIRVLVPREGYEVTARSGYFARAR